MKRSSISDRLAVIPGDPDYTEFASPNRSGPKEIARQAEVVRQQVPGLDMFEFVPDAVLLLNQTRQIVYANAAARKLVPVEEQDDIAGCRPGELLNCSQAFVNPAGCGTTRECSTCGGARALIAGLEGRDTSEEVRLTVAPGGEALDLQVWSRSVQVAGERYAFLIVRDIRDQKRRLALERIFFHDILNTAGTMESCLELLEEQDLSADERDEIISLAPKLARQLVEEIRSFELLRKAEQKALGVEPRQVDTAALLQDLVEGYRCHELAADRLLEIEPAREPLVIETDRVLLSRVLSNLIKNALEASLARQTVRAGVRSEGGTAVFFVHSCPAMTDDTKLQVFKRSFSTKGGDRGLGTYSVKLLTETYLQGSVGFRSSAEEGTTFFVRLPTAWPRTAGVPPKHAPGSHHTHGEPI